MKILCELCPHACRLSEGQTGFCGARRVVDGVVRCINYGKVTSIQLDPIEKKPLRRFHPGSQVLSVGSFGCNLRCPFCQNNRIAFGRDAAGADQPACGLQDADIETLFVSPTRLVEMALEARDEGNIGIAYTYNEPLVGYEYVRDCSVLARGQGLKNVVVTNGTVCEAPLRDLLPLIDAMNIDLKGFTEDAYRRLSGDLETVKRTIALAANACHVEVTTLVVPGENDSAEEIDALSAWLSSLRRDIPLHLSRFFPQYKYSDREPTAVESLQRLYEVARRHLEHVVLGNC